MEEIEAFHLIKALIKVQSNTPHLRGLTKMRICL